MANRFLKLILSEETFWLLQHKPNAFRLLTHIANTARRYNGHLDGLKIGQCHLQSWEFYNLSRQEYRTAVEILVKRGHIRIISTKRTRRVSTTEISTKSTLVEICSSEVYEIHPHSNYIVNPTTESTTEISTQSTTQSNCINDKEPRGYVCKIVSLENESTTEISTQSTTQSTTSQPQTKKDIDKKENIENIAQSAARLRKIDNLYFDFSNWTFVGISDEDVRQWSLLYPHIDLHLEQTRATQWLKSNPTKSNKKLWRKFLTGWFSRANDAIENKKAYRRASTEEKSHEKYKESSREEKFSESAHFGESKYQPRRIIRSDNTAGSVNQGGKNE